MLKVWNSLLIWDVGGGACWEGVFCQCHLEALYVSAAYYLTIGGCWALEKWQCHLRNFLIFRILTSKFNHVANGYWVTWAILDNFIKLHRFIFGCHLRFWVLDWFLPALEIFRV
jgi:hypothetical protein